MVEAALVVNHWKAKGHRWCIEILSGRSEGLLYCIGGEPRVYDTRADARHAIRIIKTAIADVRLAPVKVEVKFSALRGKGGVR